MKTTEKLTNEKRKEIENFWKGRLLNHHKSSQANNANEKFYVLSMFPYPSGNLHMGHVRVYAISDTMARFYRLNGKHVIHPMGWDAFGLPAENAAIERGKVPHKWTKANIQSMKRQMESLCCSFDWDREFTTCHPDYYKWTQFLFLELYKRGLVYRKKAKVHWDPVDKTVLADEQIDEEGRSWRSGALAEIKYLEQWYIKTTAFAKNLLDGLDEVDSGLWRDIVDLQKHWIGQIEGVKFDFRVQKNDEKLDVLSLFSKTPEFIYGASHILVKPEHYLALYDQATDGRLEGITALNPFNGNKLPIFVEKSAEYFHEQLDSHLAIPDGNHLDEKYAEKHHLCYTKVRSTHDPNILTNSGHFEGLHRKSAFQAISEYAKHINAGGQMTSAKLRDWLISRQRYWGTPIPIIHCPKQGPVPVPYEELPVKLPEVENFAGRSAASLLNNADWLKARCSNCTCEEGGKRETDTMDTFVDSSWYFLRFLDPKNSFQPFSKDKVMAGMPVDLYIGGKEHATLHLYYARFFTHFLCSLGILPHPEPFLNILSQGMVMGQTFKVEETGKYLRSDEIEFIENKKNAIEKSTGKPVEIKWEKMSKSKHNGADPQVIIDEFGADATRLCILANVAPKSHRHWNLDVMKGILHWQQRIWRLIGDYLKVKHQGNIKIDEAELLKFNLDIDHKRNHIVKEVTFHMGKTFLLNTALSRLQEFTSFLKKCPEGVIANSSNFERALKDLIVMLSPFSPCFSSELYCGFRNRGDVNVFDETWPPVDNNYELPLIVKVNSKEVCRIPVQKDRIDDLNVEECYSFATKNAEYQKKMKNREIFDIKLTKNFGYNIEINIFVKKPKNIKNNEET
ncbi:DgyrCDS8967 [Dimorphilus gyrociliatus]|uniref:leucine--tRNA ligase n=1 Tax=Dimorphilus gyrociliatus TaxID=2664684 RepID=A0A7I8VXE4_9ANNE|nr:DgyrCDS8967 [Dimorphilus gyrociliatus]